MNKSTISKESIKGITALLVHVANIDETYTDKEKKIIIFYINIICPLLIMNNIWKSMNYIY